MAARPLLTLADLDAQNEFIDRHVGVPDEALAPLLAQVEVNSLDELLDVVVPESIRHRDALKLPAAISETAAQAELRALADQNESVTSLIGLGYYDTITPPVIRRNILENPAWYTAYTPYQPEISQGRLEAVLNFQTMVADLTGMDIANASLLDEGTAAAEAMTLLHRSSRTDRNRFVVDPDCHPQTIAVVATRAEPLGLVVDVADPTTADLSDAFGVLTQYPGSSGRVADLAPLVHRAHDAGAMVAVAADVLALLMLKSPGEAGADVVVGTTQRFGVPLGFGGPHAAYIAVREGNQRSLPGRLVGVSVDAHGRPALRLALQTREQHIRREKATSNICTAQVLLAVIASTYAIHHGPDGLRRMAQRVNRLATIAAAGLRSGGLEVGDHPFFDTVTVSVPGRATATLAAARAVDLNLRLADDDHVSFSLDETSGPETVRTLWEAFGITADVAELDASENSSLPDSLLRTDDPLPHPVFRTYRSETDLMRYLRRLADRDLALDRTMIPLGSCTMKLNAAAEMEPISWPSLAGIHPFAPSDQTVGYRTIIGQLEDWLVEITGYAAVSLQPNSGAQGELAGLLAIRAFHRSRGDHHRTTCLIPASAHGTNAASAVMAGMKVVVVACDNFGNVDVDDLKAKVVEHGDTLAVLMVTYPSTHGVFETAITDICATVHDYGGQVYLDGANLNAMVGVARPGRFGADVSHLNLHKTFCIPHGGGGPGVGPVAVGAHLAPFLPNHPLVADAGPETGCGPVAAAPWGSAGILAISWMYIRMMGPVGLKRATAVAILNANYIARRLRDAYPVLYTGPNNFVAHECILDTRVFDSASVDDIAKRLIDYGFHAPTMSFPVAGTLMVEPTESESVAELDRFCDAMLAIRAEIDQVAAGDWPRNDNPLANAPHTAFDVTATEWAHPYSREIASHPTGPTESKYWPPVSRIDGAHGDRNLICSCPPLDVLAEPATA